LGTKAFREGEIMVSRCLGSAILFAAILAGPAKADTAQVERGRYLTEMMGCNDCHTPGYFFGKPDMANRLAGSEVAFEVPGMGAFAGPNLTPDPETGLGDWSDAEIEAALRTGERPDGRTLAPSMPWRSLAGLSDEDMGAIIAYLRSLPAVRRKVPGPFGPGETADTFIFRIVPPGATVADAPK
jgi:mono/diheme cytochrome c family protein